MKWIKVIWHYITEQEQMENNLPDYISYMLDNTMPEDEEEILIVTKVRDEFFTNYDICLIDDGYMLDSGTEWKDVIAWMPLPKYEE